MRADSVCTALATTAVTIVAHHVLRPCYSTARQRAWIITFLSSLVTTLGSLPFLYDVLSSHADVSAVLPRPFFAAAVCRAFQGLLLADLLVGSRYYPQHVTLCWGWVHHTAYIVLLQYLLSAGAAHCFCLAAFMELPTLHLAASFLHPKMRHDVLFCATFLATRILFHLALIVEFSTERGLSVVQGNPYPVLCLSLAFPGHVMWFTQSVRGTLRRSRCASRKIAVPIPIPVRVAPIPEEEDASSSRPPTPTESDSSSSLSDSDEDLLSSVDDIPTPTFEPSGPAFPTVDLPTIVL